ncbi:MAG: transketolase family protein [Bacilli bacterium]|jgi:transketolase|nr:transketolase family protein [Bacilli bacterium]
MNNIPNRQAICEELLKAAKSDKYLIVCCSDSRGSASLTPFADSFPSQFVEVGIAEQDLVSISAGLAKAGKKVFAASPACFLTTRSYEQCKIDVCYSDTDVKLIGISGGVSYGSLGMSHHSSQDIACMTALPNMRVYLPSDRIQTGRIIQSLLKDKKPAYIRVGRNPVEDIYSGNDADFVFNQAQVLSEGRDLLIVSCGEMTYPCLKAVELLRKEGISASLLDMYCLKPFDEKSLLKYAYGVKGVISVEEHAPFGGLNALASQVLSASSPKKVLRLSLPDAPVVAGTSQEAFKYYGLDVEGITKKAEAFFQGL